MNVYPLFFLTASIDEGVMYRLAFRASDELQVAGHLLKNYWRHRRVFEDLRIDWQEVEGLTPERILKAIRASRVDGDSSFGIQLHRLDEKDVIVVDQVADSPTSSNRIPASVSNPNGETTMPFGGFNSLGEVALTYQITLRPEPFVQPVPMAVDESFRRRLEFDRLNAPVNVSEQAIAEFLIAPVLQEMWRAYSESLMIWSHVLFGQAQPLRGYPDYFFSKRSPLGPVLDQPYVLFVEAKSDNFDAAWAQCLAAMLAAQQMNQAPEQVIFGSVSSGEFWFFGKLTGKTLLRDPRSFTLTRLDELFAALNYVFQQAKEQALAPAVGRKS